MHKRKTLPAGNVTVRWKCTFQLLFVTVLTSWLGLIRGFSNISLPRRSTQSFSSDVALTLLQYSRWDLRKKWPICGRAHLGWGMGLPVSAIEPRVYLSWIRWRCIWDIVSGPAKPSPTSLVCLYKAVWTESAELHLQKSLWLRGESILFYRKPFILS